MKFLETILNENGIKLPKNINYKEAIINKNNRYYIKKNILMRILFQFEDTNEKAIRTSVHTNLKKIKYELIDNYYPLSLFKFFVFSDRKNNNSNKERLKKLFSDFEENGYLEKFKF
jgi:hypothetical protein